MAIITGVQATDTINQTQRVPEVDDMIHLLEPNVAPLTVLSRKMRKRSVINPKVEWLEQQELPRFTTLSASAASNATAFGPAVDIFRVGDILRLPVSGEGVEVTATAAGALTVTRALGVAITAGVSAASGDELFIVGNVNQEGASLREIKTQKVDNLSNFCEIVRSPTGLTGTDAASKQYGGVSRESLQADALRQHYRSWENIALVGIKREDTGTTGKPKRFAGGMTEYVTTNITNAAGALTEATFQTFLRSGFRYGSSRKLLLASPLVTAAIE